jgi:putative SOS response-associated peptidase YedK
MVPRSRIPKGVRPYDTMNARSESISEKRSFSGAWNSLQFCLIPCQSFFEPNYETGKAVRWRIGLAGGQPTAIAGLWRQWEEPDGGSSLSFTMLTLNADLHPLMSQFHKPGDEKRSVVIIRPEDYEDWLTCRSTDEARSFLQLYPAEEMHAEAFPLPPRTPRAKPAEGDRQSLLDCDSTRQRQFRGYAMTPVATDVQFDDTSFTVVLSDGRSLRVPLSGFPRLAAARPEQRSRVRISVSGAGLHWDQLDEDISVAGLLAGRMDATTRRV